MNENGVEGLEIEIFLLQDGAISAHFSGEACREFCREPCGILMTLEFQGCDIQIDGLSLSCLFFCSKDMVILCLSKILVETAMHYQFLC